MAGAGAGGRTTAFTISISARAKGMHEFISRLKCECGRIPIFWPGNGNRNFKRAGQTNRSRTMFWMVWNT